MPDGKGFSAEWVPLNRAQTQLPPVSGNTCNDDIPQEGVQLNSGVRPALTWMVTDWESLQATMGSNAPCSEHVVKTPANPITRAARTLNRADTGMRRLTGRA